MGMEKKDYHFDHYAKFRNKLLFTIFISLVIFTLIYFLFLEKDVARVIARITNPGGIPGTNETGTNGTSSCGDDCFLKLALTTSNSSYCRNMSAARSDECWQIFSNSNLSACLELKNYTLRSGCVNDFASFGKNATICGFLNASDKAACEEGINPPCMNETGLQRQLCLAYRHNSTGYCTESACFLSYATTRHDATACANLSSISERYACESVVSGENRCSQLTAYSLDYCYQLLAQYTGDYSYCTGIGEFKYKANCLLDAALATRNMSYCELNELTYMPDCYVNYSLRTGDIAGCLALNNTYLTGSKDGCVYAFAENYTDPAACNYASTIFIRLNCYGDSILTAPQNLSLDKCAAVTHPGWKDKCYSAYAIAVKDASICDFVLDSGAKSSCFSSIPS